MCAAITTAAIGVASAGYSIYSGEQQKADAKKAMENLEVPELENPYENMRISTMGSDLIREEGQRRTANIIEGLQGGGARNMMSAIPRLVAMNDDINQQARLEIDEQMLDRERMIAGYGEKQNQYAENRYQDALQGLGRQYDVGNQRMWNGIRTGVTSLGSLGRAIDSKSKSGSGNKGGSGTQSSTKAKNSFTGKNAGYWNSASSYNEPWRDPFSPPSYY